MTALAAAQGLSQPGLAGQRLGRYEVLTQLASGGMGGVYVARAVGVAGFERLVAVKVLHPHLAHEEEFISMFLDEARLAARIRHPNVVATLDINDTQGAGFYLVMDYIEGDHLGGLLRESSMKRERISVPAVARILLDALAGLGAAHGLTDGSGEPLHLVHRDISPHNILVGSDGSTRLTDFGVAKAEVRLSSTRKGQFKGKLSYMAPEHASTGAADQRSDLFSMGIVLWECLAGRRLFRGENNAMTLNKILHDPIPRLDGTDPALAPFDTVLARALARPPDARFQSADEFAEALEAAARGSGEIGSARDVARVVHRYAAEKLEEEKRRIKAAIDHQGRSGIGLEAPLPLPRGGSSSRSYRSMPPAQDGDATVGARPSAVARPRPSRRRRWIPIAALAALALGGLLLWVSPWSPGGGASSGKAERHGGDTRSVPRDETARTHAEPTAASPEPPPGQAVATPPRPEPSGAPQDGGAQAAPSAPERTAPARRRMGRRHVRRPTATPRPPGPTRVDPGDDLLDNPYLR